MASKVDEIFRHECYVTLPGDYLESGDDKRYFTGTFGWGLFINDFTDDYIDKVVLNE